MAWKKETIHHVWRTYHMPELECEVAVVKAKNTFTLKNTHGQSLQERSIVVPILLEAM